MKLDAHACLTIIVKVASWALRLSSVFSFFVVFGHFCAIFVPNLDIFFMIGEPNDSWYHMVP